MRRGEGNAVFVLCHTVGKIEQDNDPLCGKGQEQATHNTIASEAYSPEGRFPSGHCMEDGGRRGESGSVGDGGRLILSSLWLLLSFPINGN
jgi:hypothetical protein